MREQGDASAQQGLDIVYQYDYGVPVNLPVARRWYEKAAV